MFYPLLKYNQDLFLLFNFGKNCLSILKFQEKNHELIEWG